MNRRQHTTRSLLRQAQGDASNTAIGFENDMSDASVSASQPAGSSSDTFSLVVVEEVISDPYYYFSKPWPEEGRTHNGQLVTLGDVYSGRVKSDDNDQTFLNPWNVENPSLVDFMPANSIKGFLKKAKNSGASSKSILCFPFFSSHFSMPVKPGETVIVTNIGGVYYWMTRKASYLQIEDVNYTFSERETNFRKVKKSDDENTYIHFNGGAIRGSNIDFQNIINSSLTYSEEFTGEPVPRQVKDCGSLLLQGSNNSHIELGKEKFELENTVSPEIFSTGTSAEETTPERKPISPAIDMCVLRKKEEIFNLRDTTSSHDFTSNISVEGDGLAAAAGKINNPKIRYYENDKTLDRFESKQTFFREFYDSDILNCAARIYMSNAKSIDDLLFALDFEGEPDMSASPQDIDGAGDYGTVAVIGTNARLVGTETIKLHNIAGSSGIQFTPQGDVIIFGNTEGGSKIILEAGGDIKIVPGTSGVIKLGSDSPLGGITATETAVNTEGIVTGTPITTTAGGAIGLTGGFGTFGKKVLIDI